MELSVAELSGGTVTDAGNITVPDPPWKVAPELMHPHFSVVIDCTHHYVQKTVNDSWLQQAIAKMSGDELVHLASGLGARKLEPCDEPYYVDFCSGTIDDIIHERNIAKALEPIYAARKIQFQPLHGWGFNRIVADHIEKAAMVNHAKLEHWAALRVVGHEDFDLILKDRYGEKRSLQDFLRFYFNLEA